MSFEVGWKEVKLSEVINFSNGKKRPPQSGEIPVYGGNGILDYTDQSNAQGENIIIGRVGAYCGNVYYENRPCWISDNAISAKSLDGNSSRYLYYKLKSLNLHNFRIGSSQPLLTQTILKDITIELPNITEQILIATILTAIDNKIELNNAINKNLEEMAQALFKRWFIDFEFPNENGEPYKSSGGELEESELGLIPKGWKVDTIGNSTSIVTRGIAPKYAEDTGKFVINQKCIRNGVINTDLARQHQSNVVTDKVVRFGDVLINSTGVGTLGRAAQVFEDLENYTVDSHVTIVRSKSENMICYLGSLLKRMQYDFENAATGSTGQTELGRETIKQMRILLPYDPIVQEYSNFYFSLYEKITLNQNENKILVQVRDSLLPKLMSGEIRVPIDEHELMSSTE